MKKKNASPHLTFVGTMRLIKVEVPDTENRIEEIKEEINKVIQSEELDSYKIEIDKINLN